MSKYNYAELMQFISSAPDEVIDALASNGDFGWLFKESDYKKWIAKSSDDKVYEGGEKTFQHAKVWAARAERLKRLKVRNEEEDKRKARAEQEKKDAEERRRRQIDEEIRNRNKPKEDDFYNTPEGRRVRMARELAEIDKTDNARIDAMIDVIKNMK